MNYKNVLEKLASLTIPYVYDNEISFLQLVRKLYKIVYELISCMKELSNNYDSFTSEVDTKIENVENDFSNLKTYVDNYFNNLNLSEEVQEIIQKMIDDGSFQEIIESTIFKDLEADIEQNTTDIETLQKSVANNFLMLNDNINGVKEIANTNTTDIASLKTSLEANVESLNNEIESNEARVDSLETGYQNEINYNTLTSERILSTDDFTCTDCSILGGNLYFKNNTYGNYGYIYGKLSVNIPASTSSITIQFSTDLKNTDSSIYGQNDYMTLYIDNTNHVVKNIPLYINSSGTVTLEVGTTESESDYVIQIMCIPVPIYLSSYASTESSQIVTTESEG